MRQQYIFHNMCPNIGACLFCKYTSNVCLSLETFSIEWLRFWLSTTKLLRESPSSEDLFTALESPLHVVLNVIGSCSSFRR